MFYLYIYIIAWAVISSETRNDKFVINKNIGPVHTPYAYKHKNFEIIFPKRVNVDSDHLTYAMKHHYDDIPENPEDKMHLVIPIKGRNHHLELRPSRHIMSPGMLIESFKHPRKSHIRRAGRKNKQCHYTGKIRGIRRSRAAVSTCNGLSGYIQTGQGLYMIEPKHATDHSLDRPHPHVLYSPRTDERTDLFCSVGKDVDGDDLINRKRKRDISDVMPELNIETLVVLDQSILKYHKDIDIENYVLTVFNIAHDLFHDSTLGVNINLAIVRLIRLEVEDHEMNLAMNHNVKKSMAYFRLWQKRINPREDAHPNHHDMAVLLTRIDICGSNKTCGFLGAARSNGMCDPENEAVIAQDSGLLVGHTIAHEIGHTLNMPHDEKPLVIDIGEPHHRADDTKSTVMSAHISASALEWSNCSSVRLKQFIEYGLGSCLFDAPTDHSFVMADQLSGVMYDGDYQCKQFLGPNAALCMTGIECDNLICYVEDKGCIETHTPPAQGTPCGENKWCFHGECVEVGERPNTVHGNWSDWTEWSECTRTCGSGVASQMRYCNSPAPKNGGQFCMGENIRFKICSTDPCDPTTPSFRDVQCGEFDTWIYPGDGKIHQWKNYAIHDENPCALYCVSEDGNIASLRPRVIDGTTCYRGIRNICISGICKEIPCDLDLQSSAVEDRCGVCKGDGTTCDIVRGEKAMTCTGIVEPEKQIMTIPAGAVNVKIEEMLPSETRIQVRDKAGTSIYIDGDMLGMYNVHGSSAWVGIIRTKQEAISITGPLNETISIWANIQQNSTMRYTYGTQAKIKRIPSFSWDYLDWSPCSAECGPGLATSIAKCVEHSSGLVDESYCKDMQRPKNQMRPCETAPCIARWFVGDWGECEHCPSGTRSRIVKCYRPVGIGEGELDIVADNLCANNKPKSSESCTCIRDKRDDVTVSGNSSTSSPITNTSQAANGTSTICTETTEETDDMGMIVTQTIPTKATSTSKIKTVMDFRDLKELKLTVHTELEGQKYPKGLPHISGSTDTKYEYRGKDALKFMNTLQHDFSNNKTRI